jgi:hypothetical protein
MTYGTWRASMLYGVSGSLIGFIFIETRILNRTISGLLSLILFLLITAQVLPSLDSLRNYIEIRNNWWSANVIREESSKKLTKIEEQYRKYLPADFGGGAWIDECFKDLVKVSK